MKKTVTLLAVLVLASLQFGSAHRSGCHRWHTCPSDTGSYGTTYTPAAPQAATPRVSSVPARPRRPRFATPGATYLRAADLLPKALGSVQRQRGGWYQLSVRKARVWFRAGSRLARLALTASAKPAQRTLKATPYVDQNSVYVPAEVLRIAGCVIDASTISSGFITVACGSETEIVNVKRY